MASKAPAMSVGTKSVTLSLEKHKELLWATNKKIHSHPELAYKEVIAHDTLCDALEGLDYKVQRHAYGLETAFQVEFGSGGAVVAYNAEYDALPGIGHACGHNLIATSSLAAFLATAEALRDSGGEGRVRLLGTPAEEDVGGKIDLIKAGAYKDVDACLMGHPGPPFGSSDGIVLGGTMALAEATVAFTGVSAHAGLTPWLGKNALDAAVAAYTSIAMLRQQTGPSQRIQVIISKGGEATNIIPYETELKVCLRAEAYNDLQDTQQRLLRCCEGAAAAAGCEVAFNWLPIYKELRCSEAIGKRFEQSAKSQGQDYVLTVPYAIGAATDQGNVSYEVPSLHPSFGLPVGKPDVYPHHPDFEQVAGTSGAFEAAMRFASAMALTGIDILNDEELRKSMVAEFAKKRADIAAQTTG